VFVALAHRPDEFRAFFAYHDPMMLREGGLSKAEREMFATRFVSDGTRAEKNLIARLEKRQPRYLLNHSVRRFQPSAAASFR
jgi:hypothetical protein